MNRYVLLATLASLSACGSGGTVEMENASVGEVAREMDRADTGTSFVNPGKWEQSATLLEIDAPGMPPQIAEAMKSAMQTTQVHQTCLSAEQAKSPREDFFAGAEKNCRYDHFKWGNGEVDLKLLCAESGTTRTMELTGTYEPDSYQMAMTVSAKGNNPAETMNMKMKVDAKRVGDCDSSEG